MKRKPDLRCTACVANKCEGCRDLDRVQARLDPICPCKRKKHPALQLVFVVHDLTKSDFDNPAFGPTTEAKADELVAKNPSVFWKQRLV